MDNDSWPPNAPDAGKEFADAHDGPPPPENQQDQLRAEMEQLERDRATPEHQHNMPRPEGTGTKELDQDIEAERESRIQYIRDQLNEKDRERDDDGPDRSDDR